MHDETLSQKILKLVGARVVEGASNEQFYWLEQELELQVLPWTLKAYERCLEGKQIRWKCSKKSNPMEVLKEITKSQGWLLKRSIYPFLCTYGTTTLCFFFS